MLKMEYIKFISRQDCYYKLTEGNSGETSINLPLEIFDYIKPTSMTKGDNRTIVFNLFRDEFIKGLCFLVNKLPLYITSSSSCKPIDFSYEFFIKKFGEIVNFFGDKEQMLYAVNLFYRPDGRVYLNNLSVDGFNIRNFLIEDMSALLFKKEKNEIYLHLSYFKKNDNSYNSENVNVLETISEPDNDYETIHTEHGSKQDDFVKFLIESKSRKQKKFSNRTIHNYINATKDELIQTAVERMGYNSLFEISDIKIIEKIYNIIIVTKKNKEWNYVFSATLNNYKDFLLQKNKNHAPSEDGFLKFMQTYEADNGKKISDRTIRSYLSSAKSDYIKDLLVSASLPPNLYENDNLDKIIAIYEFCLKDVRNQDMHRTPSSMLKFYIRYLNYME